MSAFYLLILITVGILYSIYTRYKKELRQQDVLKQELAVQNPAIDWEYNRFNTKNERSTFHQLHNGWLKVETDMQTLQIANQTLVSKISSEVNGQPTIFSVVVQPFEKKWLQPDGYRNFNQQGRIILGSYGADTKTLFTQIPPLSTLIEHIPDEPKMISLNLNSFTLDESEKSVIMTGKFFDDLTFKVILFHESYRAQFHTPISSITNLDNFVILDTSENPQPLPD